MARRTASPAPCRYAPLVAHVLACEGGTVTLSLDAIAAIVGRDLPITARYTPAFWQYSRWTRARFVLDLHAGGRLARLDVPTRTVTLRRILDERAE